MFRKRASGVSAVLLLTGAILAVPASAGAAIRYAEPGGDGPEPCLASDPCDLEGAVESVAVTDDDEVVLRPGDYVLGADDLQITNGIELHGQHGQPRPRLLTSAATGVRTSGADGAVISDLEILHTGEVTGLMFAGVTVERVEVTTDGTFACVPFFTATIRDSVCRSTGPAAGYGLAIEAGGGAAEFDVRAVNVTAVGTTNGIDVLTNDGPDIAVIGSNVIAQGGTFDIRAGTDGDGGADADVVLDHSNFQTAIEEGVEASVTDPGSATNQLGEPLFVNPAAGDFHQLRSSPTRNAGALTPDLGTLDIDREPRNQAGAPDIGADEFDEIRPNTRITKGPRKRMRTRRRRARAFFRFAADEPGASFQCKLDRRSWVPCSSPFRRKVRAKRGKGARHVFRVRAIDISGNVDATPAVRRWRVIRSRR